MTTIADYILRGSANLIRYMKTLGTDTHTARQRVAAAARLPIGLFAGNGREGSSFVSRRYTEAEAQAIAGVLGVSVANVTTNGGQEIVG